MCVTYTLLYTHMQAEEKQSYIDLELYNYIFVLDEKLYITGKQVLRVKKLVGRQGAPEPRTTC